MSIDTVKGFRDLANSITPLNAVPGTDAAGGTVGSLTEAVMGMTSALIRIAEAIEEVAQEIREK